MMLVILVIKYDKCDWGWVQTQKDKQAVVKQLTKDIAQRKQRLKDDVRNSCCHE